MVLVFISLFPLRGLYCLITHLINSYLNVYIKWPLHLVAEEMGSDGMAQILDWPCPTLRIGSQVC